MNRAVDLSRGVAYVVTDLHGEWGAYARYRDHFLYLHEKGAADYLIFLGDMIHGYGPADAVAGPVKSADSDRAAWQSRTTAHLRCRAVEGRPEFYTTL